MTDKSDTVFKQLLQWDTTLGASYVRDGIRRYNRQKLHVEGREKRQRFSKGMYQRLFDQQKGVCPACEEPLFIPARRNQIDHINPEVVQGFNRPGNLQLLHPLCNQQKAAKTLLEQSKHSGKTMRELTER
jgi:hypothetical protein